ncbi:hypothetical protein PV08_03593 [Exophiala spinifera]|uniref:Flavoprotein oxygenase n=1 Tax=Exophiala spinifera TaxID=91928 RepID=A0A0D2C6U1_9EURO|nr:uncharacterized protein PV08_03593 [Exophiala spinifera]KIW19299.1 hypothetical protein PV08_03593 [Exophiala spinifera]
MMSSSPSAVIEDFAYQHSSPLSLRQQRLPTSPDQVSEPHDYNFSGAVYDEGTSGTDSENQTATENDEEEELLDIDRRASGCSSISSFPASVSHQVPSRTSHYGSSRTPTKRDLVGSHGVYSSEGPGYPARSPRAFPEYQSPFRHPSSVRALQMRDEVMSDTRSVLRHRRSGSQMSSYSARSSYSTPSSPAKRTTRSNRSSPQKTTSSLRKEFPLVLLHCTMLPPTLLSQAMAHEDSLICELLPEEYQKRWHHLRDKLVEDVEIKTRGILIAHPRDDYELLEERLLESLDLERPRIRHNHYFPHDSTGTDSGFESGSTTSDDNDDNGPNDTKCPDCGRKLRADETPRKWEVKVFAANGLLKAGAWGAAWQEMEKVDVEVRVWLPEDIRRDLEAKIALIDAIPGGSESNAGQSEVPTARDREVYGASGRSRSQSEIDGFFEQPAPTTMPEPRPPVPQAVPDPDDLGKLMVAAVQKFSHERRNLLVMILSGLLLLFAMRPRTSPEGQRPGLYDPSSAYMAETLTTTVTTTRIAVATATATATVTTSILAPPLPVAPGPPEDVTSSLAIKDDDSVSWEALNGTRSTMRPDGDAPVVDANISSSTSTSSNPAKPTARSEEISVETKSADSSQGENGDGDGDADEYTQTSSVVAEAETAMKELEPGSNSN